MGSLLAGALIADSTFPFLDINVKLRTALHVAAEALDAVDRALLYVCTRTCWSWTLASLSQLPADAIPMENVSAG